MENNKVHAIYKNYGYNNEMNQIVHIPTSGIIQQRIHPSGNCTCTVSDGETPKKLFMSSIYI